MVIWISGNTQAGKTTLAKALAQADTVVHLDGDSCRETINRDLGLSEADRRENCLRIARLANMLHSQGFDIVVSVIAPYRDLREQIQEVCGCTFLYLLDKGRRGKKFPYEAPDVDRTFSISTEK